MSSSPASSDVRVPRLLGRVDGPSGGPLLVAVAGVHGNEPEGVRAVEAVLRRLRLQERELAGSMVGLAGNLAALAAGVRYVHRDLNRIWGADTPGGAGEGHERRELGKALEAVIGSHEGPVLVVDLHTSSAPCLPFSLPWPGPPLATEVARKLGVPLVRGFEEHLHGLLIEWLAGRGVPALALEVGAPPPAATSVLADLLLRVLDAVEIVHGGPGWGHGSPGVPSDLPSSLRVVHRHRIPEGSRFVMEPGFASFQPVHRGQLLAHQDGRPVLSPVDGWILLPRYQATGDDGFFLAQADPEGP